MAQPAQWAASMRSDPKFSSLTLVSLELDVLDLATGGGAGSECFDGAIVGGLVGATASARKRIGARRVVLVGSMIAGCGAGLVDNYAGTNYLDRLFPPPSRKSEPTG